MTKFNMIRQWCFLGGNGPEGRELPTSVVWLRQPVVQGREVVRRVGRASDEVADRRPPGALDWPFYEACSLGSA